jgi:hypothetical protein
MAIFFTEQPEAKGRSRGSKSQAGRIRNLMGTSGEKDSPTARIIATAWMATKQAYGPKSRRLSVISCPLSVKPVTDNREPPTVVGYLNAVMR